LIDQYQLIDRNRIGYPGQAGRRSSQLAARRPCEVRSAGTGARGQRWYGWSWLATAYPQHYLLIRHLRTGELALAICAVTAAQLRHRTDTQAPPPVRPGQAPLSGPRTLVPPAHPAHHSQ
jgi:hypothetical protein